MAERTVSLSLAYVKYLPVSWISVDVDIELEILVHMRWKAVVAHCCFPALMFVMKAQFGPLTPRQHPSIRQRFRHVNLLHRAAAFEVGQGAGDAQHAVEAARRQAEAVDRLGDELAAG